MALERLWALGLTRGSNGCVRFVLQRSARKRSLGSAGVDAMVFGLGSLGIALAVPRVGRPCWQC